ncbi:MAG: right-handed parallel beta-helix repeat-containing protein [Pseudomonadota bacterium]
MITQRKKEPEQSVIVVAKKSWLMSWLHGDCKTISAAIKKAKAGDRILVKPGIYQEDLVIDKPLEIIGDGDVADIVVESKNASCISMETDKVLVRGLSLRNRAGNGYAVDIPQGKLTLENCDISSETLSCVGIHGAEGIVSYCQIHDSEESGVVVYENGTGRIENCQIFGNALAGIEIKTGGNPVVQKCTIKQNDYWAVYVYDGGAGTIENCDLQDNAKGAWHIQSSCQVRRGENREDTYTIEVSPTGKCKTISAAIKKAKAGNRVLVKPGIYQENLIIDKPLEIIGEGEVADIIIESKKSHCISMETDYALVRGLSLRNRAKGCFAVYIPQGILTLENCDITSNALSCVGIHGAEGIVSYCKIHNSKQGGVYVYENGTGRIENCQIFGNALAGITISKGSNPIVQHCKIHDGKDSGVLIWENGTGRIENCEIFGNAKAGIAIREEGNPVVQHCKIHHSKEAGVYVYENGTGRIENCQIFGNVLAGIAIREGSNPVIQHCKIHDGKQGSILVYKNGIGRIENCDIGGIQIREGSNPVVQHCKIHDSEESGVVVYENGTGLIENCQIFGNALAGIEIKTGGNPVVQKSTIKQNNHWAVYIYDGGAGTIENCDLQDNAKGAWHIQPGCQVHRSGNKEDTYTIEVSPTGKCKTISAAIKKAKAGNRVLVKPGIYQEDLVIDKPLKIVGDGKVADIIIESKNTSCIYMETDKALIRGLSLRNRAEGDCAVDIPQGKLRLENCDITSNTLLCVHISGSETEGIISYCKIHDSKGIGIIIDKNGTGRIENCEIFGNALSGIAISEGGNPVVQKCTIKQNKHWAVYVYDGGAGTIKNCDLRDNAKGTWHIQSGCQVHGSGNKEDTYTIEVSPTGKCKTINAAIKKAKAGARILVKPGVYQEELVIDKPLEIIGEGKVAEIIIESKNADCIFMKTDKALVRGLSLRNRAEGYFAVYIPQGKLTLENCDISSETLSCVGIHGAEGIISYCQIHDSKQSGVYIYKNGTGRIENCQIFGNALAGIAIIEGSNPIVQHCKIQDGKQGSILVYKNGIGRIENCEIVGIQIRDGGNPLVQHCQIHDSKQSGVMVWENGTGRIENCQIFGNALAGIAISEGGNPVVQKCTIKENKHWAVYVYDGGAGTIENCDLRDNAKSTWHIQSGCQVHRSGNKEGTTTIEVSPTGKCKTISAAIKKAKAGNRISVKPGNYQEELVIDKPLEIIGEGKVAEIIIESKNADCIFMKTDKALVRGLSLRNRAEGYFAVYIPQGKLTLENCDISSETLSCVGIHGSETEGIVSYCKIHDSKQSGVYVYKNGTGRIENCQIFGNALAGIAIIEGGNPIVQHCKIQDGKQGSILVYKNGIGRIENCDIVGIQIRDGGNPVVQRCQIHDSKQSGVMVWENGTGRIENCEIFRNALSGITITEGGNPVVQKCSIKQNKHWAVYVYKDGAATIENCDLRDNVKGAWHIQSGCQVHGSGNKE